jgi:hypothetical protein
MRLVKEKLVKTVGGRFSTIVMRSIGFLIGRVKQSRGRGCRASAFSKRPTTIHKSVQALPIPHPPSPQPQVKSLQQPLTRSRRPFTRPLTSHRLPSPTTPTPNTPSSPGTQPWHTLSMANYSNQPRNSSSNYYQATKEVAARSNIQASAYTVDAVDMALKGFHYSTCGAGGTYPALSHPHSL